MAALASGSSSRGNETVNQDSSGQESSSRYQAGVLQGGFYALSSVVLLSASSAESEFHSTASSSKDSSESWT